MSLKPFESSYAVVCLDFSESWRLHARALTNNNLNLRTLYKRRYGLPIQAQVWTSDDHGGLLVTGMQSLAYTLSAGSSVCAACAAGTFSALSGLITDRYHYLQFRSCKAASQANMNDPGFSRTDPINRIL